MSIAILICMIAALVCQALHLAGMSIKLSASRTISFFDLSYFFLIIALLWPAVAAKV